MSRIGKQPILLPSGVEATVNGMNVTIKGGKGQLQTSVHANATVELRSGEEGNELVVTMADLDSKLNRSLWGTTRSNLQNMVTGVQTPYQKKLEVNGVGYKVAVNGQTIRLDVGFSHPVEYKLPEGISAEVEKNLITLTGIDKQIVGQVAAEIRKVRKPEPYKGKGIKYLDEIVRRKAGKAAKA
ncbi:50S ribosomal protein L6 [Candidatus Uhrbacteria bacterium CG10_big_fil_rev_8_21_14_0_10_50_16]|uniref:Large ribosomal subunit protein uL6 n=1 Tax=Candidatus Uhrbacteria bacterium CG10_big_fil_rev_8_21_14_0_10_50_16 TaxID=1975039 RepID=A0A2H0RNJ1_9BACT|nr:MAG: 50S ribosomal protein L6 [Candidatus Uhrbacteria bacterium CG10_big_fil_rev_8_21_14_0_10_50_16]